MPTVDSTAGGQPRRNETARLTDDQLAAWERDGFLTGIPVLEAGELDVVRAAVDALQADLRVQGARLYEIEQAWLERPGAVVCHFLGGWRVSDVLRRLVFDPRVTVPAAQALGVRRLRFWHDQVFYKPAHHPGVVPFHQDYSYWTRAVPANHVTVNVMLDDADVENGCLEFVPGSHRFGLLPRVPFDGDLEAVVKDLDPAARAAFRPRAAPVAAGHATLHHSHTLHGSRGNRSPRPRRSLVLNYMGPDTRSAQDEPLLEGVPAIPRGAVIEGEHFPIVLDLDAGPGGAAQETP